MTGIPDEASDEVMNLVDVIESVLQGDGIFSYAPDGTPCLTWKGRQSLGHLLDTEIRKPQNDAAEAMRQAREARLGQSAHLGKLPDRLFAAMMDGAPHEVSDLCRLFEADASRKQVWNALGYLKRHGKVEKTRYGSYRIFPATPKLALLTQEETP